MANFDNLALTVNGVKALLAAQTGTTLKLSKIGMGSGSTTNSTRLTKLVTPKLMLPISEKKTDSESGLLTIIAKMTNEDLTEGFYWRETGLFFEDSAGNDVLFAYACVTDQYDYVPAYSDQRYIKHIRIANIITDSTDITVKENEGLLYVDTLTFSEFKDSIEQSILEHENNNDNPHCVTKEQIGLGNVPNVATNNQTPSYTVASTLTELKSGEKLSVAFGKIAKAITDLISHIGNTSNPHKVTKAQVGLGNVTNTSDTNKPVSTAQQAAIDAVQDSLDSHVSTTASTSVLGHVKFGTAAGTACQGNDSRLSDTRTPKTHAATTTTYGAGTTINYGHVKLSDSSAVTNSTGLALPATEKNATIEGTLANQISSLNTNFNNHSHDDRYYPKTEANVRYTLRNAVFPEQIATNALHVNTGDMFSSANYPIRVVNGTTANLPNDVGLGVRYTHYYNSTSIIVEIVGVNLSGIPLHYANYYNGSNWVGWYKI